MSLESIQSWLMTSEGLRSSLDKLRVWSATLSFGDGVIKTENTADTHDWNKLLLAASILSESRERETQEYALMVAESAVCFSSQGIFQDAGSLILTRLSNHRAVQLAEDRELLQPDVEHRVGMMEQLLSIRRRLASEISMGEKTSFLGNRFQTELWSELAESDWLSATAPTAAGKTFAVLNWVLSQHAAGKSRSSVFVAPTRALVSEVERQLNELKIVHGLNKLKVTSLPINDEDFQSEPFISVFTQERLHIFLNAGQEPHQYDIAIVDEAQKLSDERRGVILQDAVERVARANSNCRFVFLSPHSDNPEVLLKKPRKEPERLLCQAIRQP
jgi:superfamily II RNA helicase